MKELNEMPLHSWRPRRPAAGLKRRILSLDGGEADIPPARWLWGALAPTMACALLTLAAFNHGGEGLNPKLATTLILSSQNNAAYATVGAQTPENHLAGVTFDWTNQSVFQSSMRFTPTTNFSN
jgi:hypothetical protein